MLTLGADEHDLADLPWEEMAIVSAIELRRGDARQAEFHPAPGEKCARCWRVLPEVAAPKHLCRRCEAVVEARA